MIALIVMGLAGVALLILAFRAALIMVRGITAADDKDEDLTTWT